MNHMGAKVYVIFVDLFLLVLTFYMLNSSFTDHVFRNVDLAEVRQKNVQEGKPRSSRLVVLADGGLLMNGRVVRWGQMQKILADSQEAVDLAVEKDVAWKRVAEVMEVLRTSGRSVYVVYENIP